LSLILKIRAATKTLLKGRCLCPWQLLQG
jgi:hypothetical protein